jgi:hypothetical protein
MDILNQIMDNPGRLIIVGALIGIFLLFWRVKKSFTFAWISVFILSFAFNISLQLDFLSAFYDPYVLNIKVNYLIPTIYLLDVLFVALFCYLAINVVPILIKKSKYTVWLIIVVLVFWVSHVAFHPELVSIINSTRLVVYLGAGVLASLASYRRFSLSKSIEKYKVWYLGLLLFSALLQVVLGVLQYSQGTDLGLSMLGESDLVAGMVGSSFIVSDSSVFLRAYGTFPHPNLYGAFFVVLMFVGLRSLNVKKLDLKKYSTFKDKVVPILSISLAVLSVFGILLSFSRIAYLGAVLLVVGVFMDFVLGSNGFGFKNVIRNSKFDSRYANSGLLLTGLDRTLTLGASLSERVYLLVVASKMFLANIWIGVGAGLFVQEIPNVIERSLMLVGYSGILLLQPVHNTFMLFLVEYGLIGLLAIGIITWLVRKLFIEFTNVVAVKKGLRLLERFGGYLGVGFVIWFITSLNMDHFWLSLAQGLGLGVGIVLYKTQSGK